MKTNNNSLKNKQKFNKKFLFINNESFLIPDNAYNSNKWSIKLFQQKKEKLNSVKSLLNNFNLEKWSKHTKRRDPSGFIMKYLKQKVEPELLTQAWCKFYECLSNYPIIPQKAVDGKRLTSLHLCEAPGAFVCALNHYLKTNYQEINWDWFANTLNPYYDGNDRSEMIPDSRLMKFTEKNWYFGLDLTGDVTKYYNYLNILETMRSKRISLITADGSVDCIKDPGNQERQVEYLHYCETITALSLLEQGGSYVLKIFTIFEDTTICLLYLLNLCFRKVSVFKPASSKCGNSEVYVISTDYKGLKLVGKIWEQLLIPFKLGHFETSMFCQSSINNKFLQQLVTCMDLFMKQQTLTIIDNVNSFKEITTEDSVEVYKTKAFVANRFINKFGLKRINESLRVVPFLNLSQFWFSIVPEKLKFNRGLYEYFVDYQICLEIINIKLGKSILEVKNSNFCSNQFISCYNFYNKTKRVPSLLYAKVLNLVNSTTTVINLNDIICSNHSEYQRCIFNLIYSSVTCNKSNLILIKTPLITTFLAGLLYVLISAYQKVYIYKNSLVLYNLKLNPQITSILNEIKQRFDQNNQPFSTDIYQIVSPILLTNSTLYSLIWNYNEIVFKSMK